MDIEHQSFTSLFQEADRQFRYIALELCTATLADHVAEKAIPGPMPDMITIFSQALQGIAHLHSLDIGEWWFAWRQNGGLILGVGIHPAACGLGQR